jgi:hypothetical protein
MTSATSTKPEQELSYRSDNFSGDPRVARLAFATPPLNHIAAFGPHPTPAGLDPPPPYRRVVIRLSNYVTWYFRRRITCRIRSRFGHWL